MTAGTVQVRLLHSSNIADSCSVTDIVRKTSAVLEYGSTSSWAPLRRIKGFITADFITYWYCHIAVFIKSNKSLLLAELAILKVGGKSMTIHIADIQLCRNHRYFALLYFPQTLTETLEELRGSSPDTVIVC